MNDRSQTDVHISYLNVIRNFFFQSVINKDYKKVKKQLNIISIFYTKVVFIFFYIISCNYFYKKYAFC